MLNVGERFKNEKGITCQVIAIAADLRDGSNRLVYQEMSGEFRVLIGELPKVSRAAEPVKTEEKPFASDALEAKKEARPVAEAKPSTEVTEIFEGEVNPKLMAFLEADSLADKLSVLDSIKDYDDESLLIAIEASLDITASEGTPEERIYFIKKTLRTRAKFEGDRLR